MRIQGFRTFLLAAGLMLAPATLMAQSGTTGSSASQPSASGATQTAPSTTLAPGAVAATELVGNQTEAAAPAAATAAPADAAAAPAAPTVAAPPMMVADPKVGQPQVSGWTLPEQVSPNGQRGKWMHNVVLLPIIVAITLFVLALLIYVAFRFRQSANPVPSKTSHNTVIEVIWTLVPVIILVAIAVPSIDLLARQFKPAGANAVTIKAIGNQWYWTYQYPDNGGFEVTSNMLKEQSEVGKGERSRTDADGPRLLAVDNRILVPVGREIRLITTSNDVIHSWALPSAWIKLDAVPGRLNETSFTIEKPGVYFGQCSELCGARHAYMPIAVEAVAPAVFDQWILSKGGTIGRAAGAPAAPAVIPAVGTNDAGEATLSNDSTDTPMNATGAPVTTSQSGAGTSEN